ncbi:MAG: RDD family protein [Euryarchaeota archaeon]|nr:RDD family protein [Euryarchaeota archaeon]
MLKDEYELFKALSHPIRAKIIELIYENGELSYTEILTALKIDTGQLNFHLRNVSELYTRTENGNYTLNEAGKLGYYVMRGVKKRTGKEEIATEPHAPVEKRVMAALIDYSLFIGSPFFFILFLNLWIPFGEQGRDPVILAQFLHAIFFLTLIAFMSMETYNGQTIGKYIMKIKAVKETGRKINLVESTIRNVAKIFFLPLDLLTGLLFFRKKGYIRFADYYTKVKVVDVSMDIIE